MKLMEPEGGDDGAGDRRAYTTPPKGRAAKPYSANSPKLHEIRHHRADGLENRIEGRARRHEQRFSFSAERSPGFGRGFFHQSHVGV